MTLTEVQRKDLERLSRPLMAWISDNFHPYVSVVVSYDRASLKETVYNFVTEDYVKD